MIDPALARRIRVVGLDVDGTMTDGGVYVGSVDGAAGPTRVEFKKYDIQDGLGVALLRDAGLRIVIITGRESEGVRLRGEELQAHEVLQDRHARKLPMWKEALARQGATDGEAAYVGDDLPDLAIMRTVGLSVAVANAVPEIREIADHVLTRPGGGGAVREFAELLLRARGEWEQAVERYVSARASADAGVGA